ncbi:MAG: hypothetical protein U5R31_05225 [Acidimicrobiia bacterium]|nr:hypothetical protein [Acidimicrobiia bacterium]
MRRPTTSYSYGEDGEDLVGAPAELAAGSGGGFGEDVEVREGAECLECGGAADVQSGLDHPRRGDGLFEGQLGHLVGDAAGSRPPDPRPVPLRGGR